MGFMRLLLLIMLGCAWFINMRAQPAIPSLPVNSPRDLDTLIHAIGKAHIVVLGEASHGTSDYYRWRAAITQRLISEQGFRCIAVEGEWADCYRVNRWLQNPTGDDSAMALSLLQSFNR